MKTFFGLTALCIGILTTVSFSFAEQTPRQEKRTDFVFDLYRAAAASRDGENISISPLGAACALGMLGPGAAGETEAEIAAVAGKQGDWADYAASLRLKELTGEGQPLKVAASLWTQQGQPFLEAFKQAAADRFDATLEQADFSTNPTEAVQRINTWVSEKTGGKIPVLFERLGETTRCVLADAVYFAADWKTGFEKDATYPGFFTLADGSKIKTSLMSRTGRFQHNKNSEVAILEIPYKNEGYTMFLLLPPQHDGLANLEQTLSAEKLAEWCGTMKEIEVDLLLPRFTSECDLLLNEPLNRLGMNAAFGRDADFSGMNGLHDLYLSEFRQRTYIRVDESGTEAAAATGASIAVKSILVKKTEPFHADRPFLYVICKTDAENKPASILFVGRLVKPEAIPATDGNATTGDTATEDETPEKPAAPPAEPNPTLSGEGGAFN